MQVRGALDPGDLIDGKYAIEDVLGEGGMALVYSARNLALGNKVALKALRPEVARGGDAAARFFREAKAAVSLSSEYVARVFDVGTLPSGAPYLVMEHLSGDSLGDLIEQKPLAIGDAVLVLLQVCDALLEAHALGIVHRDIKPGNIFIVRRPNGQRIAKVLDFGISKIENEQITGVSAGLTSTGAAMGTPLFMSPEQMSDAASSGPPSDVWALGVTLYLMVSGRYPFEAPSIFALARKVSGAPYTPLGQVMRTYPPLLDRLIAGCLEKEPSARLTLPQFIDGLQGLHGKYPPSWMTSSFGATGAASLTDAYEETEVVGVRPPVPAAPLPHGPTQHTHATAPAVVTLRTPAESATTDSPVSRPTDITSSRRALEIGGLVVLGLLAVLAGVAFVVVRRGPPDATAATNPPVDARTNVPMNAASALAEGPSGSPSAEGRALQPQASATTSSAPVASGKPAKPPLPAVRPSAKSSTPTRPSAAPGYLPPALER